tara:strand:+ start:209 stop:367 length:159 start_codon:yes stop_codon:yes gene_type:complete
MIKLTQRQKDTLKKHSKHHSKKHMNLMINLMTEGKGVTFTVAHKKAQKKVGT